jgi:hypothetical protein
VNKAFLDRALFGAAHVGRDALAKNPRSRHRRLRGRQARVLGRHAHRSRVHVIKGFRTPTGLGRWRTARRRKILVYADMFNLPPANGPQVPNPPVGRARGVFADNIARLNLTPDRVMSCTASIPIA